MGVTKHQLIKKGKEVFGDTYKFNIWLNSEIKALNCKPITLYDSGEYDIIYDELVRIDHGILL